MEAEGYLGQKVTFDGKVVTVVRRKKEVSFRATDVRTIQWREARKWLNGEVKFVVPGASDAPQTGNYWTKTGNDESRRYTVTFLVEQTDACEPSAMRFRILTNNRKTKPLRIRPSSSGLQANSPAALALGCANTDSRSLAPPGRCCGTPARCYCQVP